MKALPNKKARHSFKRIVAALAALALAGGVTAAITAVLAAPAVHVALVSHASSPDPIDPQGV